MLDPLERIRGDWSNYPVAELLVLAARLEQEPRTPLGLVDPVLDETCGGNVTCLIHNIVHLAQARGERLIVLPELGQHIERIDIVGIVVLDTLQTGNVTNGAQRVASDFADTLGDRIAHRIE